MARPPRPPASHQGRQREPRPHRADLSAFRNVRRLRAPASGDGALPRVEARPGGRGAAQGRARCGGRRTHRRAWRRPPPRRLPCTARHARRARGRLRRARARTTWWRSTAARSWRRASTARSRPPGRIAEALRAGKPLDIQVTATDTGLDVDVRGSGPLTAARGAALARDRRDAPSRPPHPPWRDGGAARDSRRCAIGTRSSCCRRAPSCRRPPQAKPPGAAGGRASATAARTWPTCSAASARSRCGSPNAPASPRPTTTRPRSPRCSAPRLGRRASSRSRRLRRDLFRRPLRAGRTQALRCRRVRSAAPGRRGAGARACGVAGADCGRGVVQSGDLRARCAHPGRRRLSSRRGDAGRSVPLFRARGNGGVFQRMGQDDGGQIDERSGSFPSFTLGV